MFSKLLVANRGEIACRVMRTCRDMGIATVAVYSDADVHARHVREADEAVRIGPAPARQSYLDAKAIVAVARERDVDAIHPGYGFLSEKLELIDACAAHGIAFVGPHRDAIARMGSKIESKRIARTAGVACVPGYDEDDQDPDRLAAEALRIGFPLLIKASAGGGGKGMKRVDHAADFAAQLALARAEAMAAFGDDRVLLERYIERPRHLEVQLLGDRHGGLVHLFERECSIQRNYQKLVEEAPAHHLSDAIRERLFAMALGLGRAIGYDSAGTVEFVLDADRGDEPYFLEMNTRLQVEHPVTEATTGIDLVAQQIRSAAGEPLAFAQGDVVRTGWAIEARINAEVPDESFQASFGEVGGYDAPEAPGLRIDSGVDARSAVTPHYDAMLAKVIGTGRDRAQAKRVLRDGLRRLRLDGVRTNQAFLADCVDHPAFDAVLTTRFLPDVFPDGWRRTDAREREDRAAAAAAWFFGQALPGSDRPLARLIGFRLAAPARARVMIDDAETDVRVIDGDTVDVADGIRVVRTEDGVTVGEHRYRVVGDGALWRDGDRRAWTVVPRVAVRRASAGAEGSGDVVVSAMPGVVGRLLVSTGDAVVRGTPVAVVEAMKLLHTLEAPRDGRVAAIPVRVGDTIAGGSVVVALEPVGDGA